MAARRRLDADLVRRGILASREAARSAVVNGTVTVNGAIAQKPSHLVAPGDAVELLGPPPRFVGRGGEKLAGALEVFAIEPSGLRAVDVGSSTGGFTDCLLQAGAASVVAIDVGRAQLHERLVGDDRVAVYEQTDVRSVDVAEVGGPFDMVVTDVSFISLDRILDKLAELMAPGGEGVFLIKPQFEAGKAEADKGRGVIRDPDVWRRVVVEVIAAIRRRDLGVVGLAVSPITGGSGNVEFLAHIARPAPGDVVAAADEITADAIDAQIDAAAALP